MLHTFLGPPIEETLARLFGLPQATILEVRDDYRARYRTDGLALTTVFDGIPEMLDALPGPIALCTSKPEPIARAILEATGLLDRFTAVGGSDPEAVAEPKRTTMARVLAELGSPGRATMVGDRIHDIEAARAHGLRAVGVLWWDNPHPGELEHADAIARSTAELPALV